MAFVGLGKDLQYAYKFTYQKGGSFNKAGVAHLRNGKMKVSYQSIDDKISKTSVPNEKK